MYLCNYRANLFQTCIASTMPSTYMTLHSYQFSLVVNMFVPEYSSLHIPFTKSFSADQGKPYCELISLKFGCISAHALWLMYLCLNVARDILAKAK